MLIFNRRHAAAKQKNNFWKKWHNKLWFILFIVAFLTYLPSFNNQFVWDDEQFIYKNEFVKQFDLKKILISNTIAGSGHNSNYYRPITSLSFAFDHAIWGLNPIGFHLSNTLLHIGAGLIIFKILQKLKLKKQQAFLISLIFLIHPIQTEAVVYANSRGDSMYVFWGVASLLLWITALNNKQLKKKLLNLEFNINQFTLFFLSGFCYLISILSKEIGIAVLGLQGLILFFTIYKNLTKNFKLKKILNKWRSAILAFFINSLMAGLYLYLRATSLNFGNSFNFYDTDNAYTNNLITRLLSFSKVLFTYFKLLLVPYPLHMERDTIIINSFLNPWPILAIAAAITVLIVGIKDLIKNKNKNAGLFLFGALWFVIMLSPTSGIVPINSLIYEHWLYLPMLGFFISLFALNQMLRITWPKLLQQYFWPTLFSLYILFTIRQNWLWAKPIRFYEYTLSHKQSARLYNNLAMSYADIQNHDQAIANYKKSLTLSDNYPQTYHNLANIYKEIGDNQQAITNYEQALKLSPQFYFSYSPLINLYLAEENLDQAQNLIEQLKGLEL